MFLVGYCRFCHYFVKRLFSPFENSFELNKTWGKLNFEDLLIVRVFFEQRQIHYHIQTWFLNKQWNRGNKSRFSKTHSVVKDSLFQSNIAFLARALKIVSSHFLSQSKNHFKDVKKEKKRKKKQFAFLFLFISTASVLIVMYCFLASGGKSAFFNCATFSRKFSINLSMFLLGRQLSLS